MGNFAKYLRLRSVLVTSVFVSSLYLLIVFSMFSSITKVSLPRNLLQYTFRQPPTIRIYGRDKLNANSSLRPFIPNSLKKIDWHDHERIRLESKKEGIGEQGKPAFLPKSEEEASKKVFEVNGYNGLLSDKISLNRSIPDIRHPRCAQKLYLQSLPSVSVVVPFFEEHFSTLLRTVSSVLNRSPPHLIKEIFLVDDGSSKTFLKAQLDKYLSENMPKVRVIRQANRSGLISARLAGAKKASADVLVFLDSHTEANVNWLPPLLEPIAYDYRTVVCPFIDCIDHDTFEYTAQDEGARGAFDWRMDYKRLKVLPKDEANMPEPFESPVMAGGLFAISRAFFWELGGYDPGLEIWGGEQYELSFKIWQCGGRMLDAPCSRVGHIYRGPATFPDPGRGDFGSRNARRVAEVWMDEYARFVYARNPHYLQVDPGDISEQKALRQRLQCKPFRWFMTQIAFDLTVKYPTVEPKPFAKGRIRPASATEMCVDGTDVSEGGTLLLKICTRSGEAEQDWKLSYYRDVRLTSRNLCWDWSDSSDANSSLAQKQIKMFACHMYGGNQLWRYHPDTKEMRYRDDDKCLDWDVSSRALFVDSCAGKESQRWLLDTVNHDLVRNWTATSSPVTGPAEDWESPKT